VTSKIDLINHFITSVLSVAQLKLLGGKLINYLLTASKSKCLSRFTFCQVS